MPRRRVIAKRELAADPIYQSPLVTRFINTVMRDGKRNTAEGILYRSFDIIKEKTGDDPVKVEAQLCEALPSELWTLASDVQILHGRRICRPKPLCDQCLVITDCNYYRRLTATPERAVKAARPARRPRPSHDTRRLRTSRH